MKYARIVDGVIIEIIADKFAGVDKEGNPIPRYTDEIMATIVEVSNAAQTKWTIDANGVARAPIEELPPSPDPIERKSTIVFEFIDALLRDDDEMVKQLKAEYKGIAADPATIKP